MSRTASCPQGAAPALKSGHLGLTTEEARVRRQAYGSNSMPEADPPPWRRILANFWAPVPWMLEAAILLQFMLREYVEAVVIPVVPAGMGEPTNRRCFERA